MTATSLVAVMQSSRDRRLPLITSIRASSRRRPAMSSSLDTSLEGLAKQHKLRNPRSSRLSTSLDPMKPAAPVTRIGSSGPIIKSSCSIMHVHISLLLRDVWLSYRVEAQEGEESAYVIKEFN